MKNAIVVFLVAFFLSINHLLTASSIDLEKDKKSGKAFEEATSFSDERASLQLKTSRATDTLIHVAVGELRARGHNTLAASIEQDWNQRYHGFVMTFGKGRNVGDHEAIAWLLKIHADIEFILGEALCKATRLHDLWTIAYTVPVVFSCEDHVDQTEYSKHFIPLSGIACYWTSYGFCVGATQLAGIVFACGLAATAVEEIVVNFIAPPLSPKAWRAVCR